MILRGKQLPSRARTQSKLELLKYVFIKNCVKIFSSSTLSFSKQDTVNESKHRIALDPSQKLHTDAISVPSKNNLLINDYIHHDNQLKYAIIKLTLTGMYNIIFIHFF